MEPSSTPQPARDSEPVAESGQEAAPPGASADSVTSTEDTAAPEGARPTSRRHTPWWKETLILVLTALVLALIIKTFFVQAFYIPSGSMENTLRVNDRILVEKVSYWFGTPQRGDIVVFKDPGDWLGEEGGSTPSNPITKALSFIGLYPEGGHLVKRVIGVGGDHVRCHDGLVQVNGVSLQESSYVTLAPQSCLGIWSVTVPPDHLWVLGDNRDNSADSRAHVNDPGHGFIPVDDVVGKVFVTVWPPDHWRLFPRPSTFDDPRLDQALGVVEGGAMPLGAAAFLFVPPLYRRAKVRWSDPDFDPDLDDDPEDGEPTLALAADDR